MSSNLLRFTDFVKQNIGKDYLDIAAYLLSDIEEAAAQCNIIWSTSLSKITWDGKKNKNNNVDGKEPEDKGRIGIWAEYKSYSQDGEEFTYPYISFQNFRNSIGKPGRKVSGLTLLYAEYNKYKASRKLPSKRILSTNIDLTAAAKEAQLARKETERKQAKVQAKEPILFSKMRSLNHPKTFSPYLDSTKKLLDVAKEFDIRIGKDKNGYFTCYQLMNIDGEVKGLQRIYHTPPSSWTDNKRCTWGVDTTGLMAIFGKLNADSSVVYICEGLATALAIYKATGKPVVVCLAAFNIRHVSKALKGLFANVPRVHIADNDKLTPNSGNTGVYECCMSVQENGGWVFVPHTNKGTDACDLYNESGISELKRQLFDCEHQYFNGKYSKNIAGRFNYIYDRYDTMLSQVA